MSLNVIMGLKRILMMYSCACLAPIGLSLRSFCNFLVINYIFIITINFAYALISSIKREYQIDQPF